MKMLLAIAMILVVLTPVLSHAEEVALLGMGAVSLKLGYVKFSDAPDNADGGTFIGLEGYGRVAPNVYLGAEVVHANTNEFLGYDETVLVPIELNVKYAQDIHPDLAVDAGGGISYSYASFTEEMLFSPDLEEEGWLFGVQVFGDLIYKFRWFTVGINAKYQITEELEEVGFGFSNLRLGLNVGAIF